MRNQTDRRAFSLVELLVVIMIIALVIAIVVPTLGGMRNAARSSGTAQILNEVNQAISQFDNDNRRMPGYFSAREMGSADNGSTEGMSETENIMLELMGAEIATGASAPGGGATWIQVGPNTTGKVWVNMDTLGSSANGMKAYYTPAAKNYVAQTMPVQQVGVPGQTGPDGTPQLADLVDMWGQPILAWRQDESSSQRIQAETDFAAVQAPTGNANGARFYWNSNAAFLKSPALGKRGVDQNDPVRGSLISGAMASNSAAEISQTLTAVLGHPSYPIRPTTGNPTLPSSPRGRIVLHSAGNDGVYLGMKDMGARQFDVGGPMLYGRSFVNATGQGHVDKDGKPTTVDVLREFDDLTQAAGN